MISLAVSCIGVCQRWFLIVCYGEKPIRHRQNFNKWVLKFEDDAKYLNNRMETKPLNINFVTFVKSS